MNRTASLALTFLLVASAMLVFVTAMPTAKAAGANHYFVESTDCANAIGSPNTVSDDWSNPNCWSLSSGGAAGAGEPTSADDAYFDAAGMTLHGTIQILGTTSTAHDVIVSTAVFFQLETPNMNPSETATLSIHSFTATGLNQGAGESVYFGRFGDLGTSTLKYSGTITSSTPNPDCETTGTVGGVCFYGASMAPDNRALYVEYTGTATSGTASDVSFLDSAAVTKTIYCDPGCTNDGENVNIIFGPCPGTDCTPPAAVVPPGGGPAPTPTQTPLAPLYVALLSAAALTLTGVVVYGIGVLLKSKLTKKIGLVFVVIGLGAILVFYAFSLI